MRTLRERRLAKIIDWGLESGLHIKYQDAAGRKTESVWAYWPGGSDENTVEYRHDAAMKSLNALKTKNRTVVARAYRFLKTTHRELSFSNELTARINETSVKAMRSEIMVELYRTGNTEHPLYAVLAETESVKVLKSLRKEVATIETEW